MLNLAKMKSPTAAGHKPTFSLNLSAISMNNETPNHCASKSNNFYQECKRSRNGGEHQKFGGKVRFLRNKLTESFIYVIL